VRLSAQCPDGLPPPCRRAATVAAPAPYSVAVLAFESRSRDSADLYLTEGFQDEISSRLGQITRLTVISPGVVRRLHGAAELPLDQVGGALHSRHLVLGSFQRVNSRLRVSVQLVRAQNGVQLWSESYDTQGDALQVQSDVAVRVATAILASLLPNERTTLAVAPTRNPLAWDHFQRGNHYLARRTAPNVDTALTEYEAALAADSTFVPARARMGYGAALMSNVGAWRGLSGDSLVAIGLSAADDALRRDSTSSDGWMARGYLLSFKNAATFDGTREAFERAVRLDPRNAEAWHQYAEILVNLGYTEDALRATRRALDLEPGRAVTYKDRAWHFRMLGDTRAAKEMSDSGLAIDSTPFFVHYRIQAAAGDTAMLRRMLANAERLNMRGAAAAVRIWLALARGDTAAARSELGTNPAAIHLAAVGLLDSALAAIARLSPTVRNWRGLYDLDYRLLANDPRFLALRAAMRPAAANPAIPR
jgi:TolB-like protein